MAGGIGLQPADRRSGRCRPGRKPDRELARIERDGQASDAAEELDCRPWPRARRVAGPRDRVRRQHPGHGRWRRADERERIRRGAGAGARVGRDRLGREGRASRAARARLRLPALSVAAGEIVTRASFALELDDPAAVAATLADMRARRHEAQPQGIRRSAPRSRIPTMRVQRVAARGYCSRRPAATALPSEARGSRPSTPTSSRTRGRDHGRGARRDGRGPASRARALRRGARAGGPDARRRAVSLVVGVRARRSKKRAMQRLRPVRRPPLSEPASAATPRRAARRARGALRMAARQPCRHRGSRRAQRTRAARAGAGSAGPCPGWPCARSRSRRLRAGLPAALRAHRRLRRACVASRSRCRCSRGLAGASGSSLVSVQRVQISGVRGPEAAAIDAALSRAARGMTTLDVRGPRFAPPSRRFPSCARFRRAPGFRTACASASSSSCRSPRLEVAGERTAVAADGVVLGPALLRASCRRSPARLSRPRTAPA